jgi:hypothetical protein
MKAQPLRQIALGLLKTFTLGFAVSASLGAPAYAGQAPFLHDKAYVLPSGKKVAVKFRERRCAPGKCREVDSGVWGMDGGIPRFVTEAFSVTIDGKEFAIPEKFYKDLTNTTHLSVSEQDVQVIVELQGGEGAGAYKARFMLGGMCGFERKICGEICDEMWEQSVWHNSFAYESDPSCKSRIQ